MELFQLRFAVALSAFFLIGKIDLSLQDGGGSFTADRNIGMFRKDGTPFQYASGCFHYFRATPDMWRDIMIKMKQGGLNVLETYVEWRSHEPEPGVYNFEGNLDVVSFIKTAQEVGLLVVLRPGPYICAERDFGGLPYWLLREKPDIVLRTMDPTYIKYVDKWFSVLLPMMEPLLYQNGGPIILVQVENEYGQYPKCDHQYMAHIRDLNRQYLGNDVVLFRTDIPHELTYSCDKVEGVMVSADFGVGTDVPTAFKLMRKFSPGAPLIVSEFYVGWMDHWGEPHAQVDMPRVSETLNAIFANNGSVSIYMYYGGTNFGFSNGANAPYSIQPTSYDYSAPISEAGDLTEPYFQIRDIISKYIPVDPSPKPPPTPKVSIGPVSMSYTTTLLEKIQLIEPTFNEYPLTFEALSVDSGFVSYSTIIKFNPHDPSYLSVPGLRDRAILYIDTKYIGVLSRSEGVFDYPIYLTKDQTITLVVENQGRINYGLEMHDPKGIVENVTLDDQVLSGWTMTPYPLTNIEEIQSYPPSQEICVFQPSYYTGTFQLPQNMTEGARTFLDPTNWYRGVALLNGFNLGRYWTVVGPQVTLFVPPSVLKPYPEMNTLTMLELERSPCTDNEPTQCSVKFVDTPILNSTVPTYTTKSMDLDFSLLFVAPRSLALKFLGRAPEEPTNNQNRRLRKKKIVKKQN